MSVITSPDARAWPRLICDRARSIPLSKACLHDHFGDFTTTIDGVNTPNTQMAYNDYAVGLLAVLRTTQLTLAPKTASNSLPLTEYAKAFAKPGCRILTTGHGR